MRKHATFEFSSSLETLKLTLKGESIPDELLKPLNAIASSILSEMSSGRKSFCLTSNEADREVRNLFGNVLARVLTSHNKSTVLVDCDFTNVGLSGAVARKDALGFLDMLLYGSSFSSVVQEGSGGAKVIGAGSFPVNKRMPFALEPFESTVSFLESKSECAVYCCPVEDDEGRIHPIVSSLGRAILINTSSGVGPVISLEERLESAEGIEFITVSVILKGEEKAFKDVEALHLDEEKLPVEKETVASSSSLKIDQEEDIDKIVSEQEMTEEALIGEPGSSFIPKLLTAVIGMVLIAFLVWWMIITKPMREKGSIKEKSRELAAALVDTTGEKELRGDSIEAPAASSDSLKGSKGEESVAGVAGVGSKAADSEKIRADTSSGMPSQKHVSKLEPARKQEPSLEKLNSFLGEYLIHISSFKKVENAKKDAGYLLHKGFPAFMSRVNLGAKGVWFRVYSGPYHSRSDALEAKIKLDELSRVKFTRLTKVR